MNLRLRIQGLCWIISLFLLFLSCIAPGESLIGLSDKELIDDVGVICLESIKWTEPTDKINRTNSLEDIKIAETNLIIIIEQNCDTIVGRINDTVSYPGGEAALQRFLFQNNTFNSSQNKHSLEGIVVLQLFINTDGRVYNKTIIRSVGAGIDEEALRLADLLVFNPATDSCGNANLAEYFIRVYFNERRRMDYRFTRDCSVEISIVPDEFEELYFRNGPAGFPGGKRKMKQYFRKNLVYPDKNIEGKVKLLVRINYGGWASGIHVVESSNSLLTDEAVRLVKSVRRWKPKIKNDEQVLGVLEIEMKFKKPDKLGF